MRAPFGWLGGKSKLSKDIVALLPPHETYVEIFGGAGWVLFAKERSKVEVYNDLNKDLANLFRVIKHRLAEFLERLELEIYSRELFIEDREQWRNDSITDEIEKAVIFFSLVKCSFGSVPNKGWGTSKTQPHAVLCNRDTLTQVRKRLERVYIENGDFEKIIKAYDRSEALFYLDPPYVDSKGSEKYMHNLSEEDHIRLKEVLATIKGKWFLSYGESEMIRDLYKDYNIQNSKFINYTTDNTSTDRVYKNVSELFITNYEI